MKGHFVSWMGGLVIALGVLIYADVTVAQGVGAGAAGAGAGAGGAAGGAGAGPGGAAAAGGPGDAAGVGDAGTGGPGAGAANTNPVGNWLPTFQAWRGPDPAATVVVTPAGRQIGVERDGEFPAAFPAADPTFRTFYPGICPDIDYRTDTLCSQTP